MNGVQALKAAIDASHAWYAGTTGGLSADVVNHLPPGTSHPIGEQIAHTLQSEDYIIASMLQGQPSIWERDGWGAGTSMPNVVRQDFETARNFKGDVAALDPYRAAVYAQTEAYFAVLSDAELDRELDLQPPLGKTSVGGVLCMLLIGNNFAHTGEISALKGIQEQRGYPF